MILSYDPQINRFSITEVDRPYIRVSYPDMRYWLRGDRWSPSQIRELLQLAYVLGHLGRPLIIR